MSWPWFCIPCSTVYWQLIFLLDKIKSLPPTTFRARPTFGRPCTSNTLYSRPPVKRLHAGMAQGKTLPYQPQNSDQHAGQSAEAHQLVDQERVAVSGLQLRSYTVEVPLNYSDPNGKRITIFFRAAWSNQHPPSDSQPCLLFLQGGPGMEAPRPSNAGGWLGKALHYFTVVLLDQRGTGRSTPVTTSTCKKFPNPQDLADYLQHFRADNIVRDAEVVRKLFAGPNERWSILGQSFGGFSSVSYLSFHPEALAEVLLTGGIPPGIREQCSAHRAYKSLYQRVKLQNKKFYARFPGDVARVQKLVRCLAQLPDGGAQLVDGSILTPRGLQSLGLSTLGSSEEFEHLHYMLEGAFDTEGEISPTFLAQVYRALPWATNPLYAVLHESIYCQGASSNWAAQQVRLGGDLVGEFDALKAIANGDPVLFTGEMVFPWMFDEFAALRPFKEAAHLLSRKLDWPKLYDVARLRQNRVPVAAMTYFEDMYVDFDMGEETGAEIANFRRIVSSEFMHSGIRDEAGIIEKLLNITRNNTVLF